MIKLALERLTAKELEIVGGISSTLSRHEMKFTTKEEKLAMVLDLLATIREETDE